MRHRNAVHNGAAKRALAIATIGGLAVVGLAGCGTTDKEVKAAKTSTTISVFVASNPWVETIKPKLADFEKETGIKVDLQSFGNDQLSDQYNVKLNAQSTDIDVMVYRPLQEAKLFADNGWLQDLTKNVSEDSKWGWDDFQASTKQTVTVDKKVYGVPLMTEREIIFYNQDVLNKAGVKVPKTLDELKAAAKAINDPANGTYGVAMRGRLADAVTSFSGFLYSFGADWATKSGKSGIGTQKAIDAYEYYGDLVRNYGPPGATNMGWVEASAIFAQGKAGFYIDADSQAYVFQDPKQSTIADSVNYAPFPEGPAGARPYNDVPWAAGVSALSKHKDAAWTFIKWATSSQMFKDAITEQSSPSPRQSTWDDSKAVAGFPPALVDIVRQYTKIGVGYDRPQVIQVGKARDIVGAPIVAAINGEDVTAAAKAANTAFDEFLKTDR